MLKRYTGKLPDVCTNGGGVGSKWNDGNAYTKEELSLRGNRGNILCQENGGSIDLGGVSTVRHTMPAIAWWTLNGWLNETNGH
jgi:hypothetical protein